MSVESLQAIADAVDLPPDVVRAIVTYSDYPDAMHLEMTAGWIRATECIAVEVCGPVLEFQTTARFRWWQLIAVDEGGLLPSDQHATRHHDYCLHYDARSEPVFIPAGLSPRELAEYAMAEARRIEGGRRLVLACGVDGIRYNMIRPVPHAVNPDRHARIRAKHFSRAHAMLLARTGAEIVGWDGVRHGLWLRGMGADSELRFVIMAGAAGIARRNSAWGCS